MRQNLPLPFPVRDIGDLKRAIKFVSRASTIDDATRRYIVARAKTLGHVDLLPTSWIHMTTMQDELTLDQQIKHLAEYHDVSHAQLKTVYLRGVDDFLNSDITYGSATMYGLARVQRFINERGAVIDSDLTPTASYTAPDHGIELASGMYFSPDVIYSSGEKVASLFSPGVVTGITVTDDHIHVVGDLGSLNWSYELNTMTGEHSFKIQ